MTDREELAAAGRQLFGPRWKAKLAAALMVDKSTLRRWINGPSEVPGPALAAVRCFLRERRRSARESP